MSSHSAGLRARPAASSRPPSATSSPFWPSRTLSATATACWVIDAAVSRSPGSPRPASWRRCGCRPRCCCRPSPACCPAEPPRARTSMSTTAERGRADPGVHVALRDHDARARTGLEVGAELAAADLAVGLGQGDERLVGRRSRRRRCRVTESVPSSPARSSGGVTVTRTCWRAAAASSAKTSLQRGGVVGADDLPVARVRELLEQRRRRRRLWASATTSTLTPASLTALVTLLQRGRRRCPGRRRARGCCVRPPWPLAVDGAEHAVVQAGLAGQLERVERRPHGLGVLRGLLRRRVTSSAKVTRPT